MKNFEPYDKTQEDPANPIPPVDAGIADHPQRIGGASAAEGTDAEVLRLMNRFKKITGKNLKIAHIFTRMLLIASLGLFGALRGAEPLDPFLAKQCVRCHGPEKEEGELHIDRLSRDFKSDMDTHRWAEVIERINSGEMPPEKEQKPTQEEIAAFVTTLDSLIKEGRATRTAARPAVAHYRLSRKEYQNTVYDLLGVRYDPAKPGELNEDTLWRGFERIGSELSLSPSHVDRYYRAAELQVYEFEVFLEMPTTLDFCVVATDVVDRRASAAFRGALGSRGGYIFTHSRGRRQRAYQGQGCHQLQLVSVLSKVNHVLLEFEAKN